MTNSSVYDLCISPNGTIVFGELYEGMPITDEEDLMYIRLNSGFAIDVGCKDEIFTVTVIDERDGQTEGWKNPFQIIRYNAKCPNLFAASLQNLIREYEVGGSRYHIMPFVTKLAMFCFKCNTESLFKFYYSIGYCDTCGAREKSSSRIRWCPFCSSFRAMRIEDNSYCTHCHTSLGLDNGK